MSWFRNPPSSTIVIICIIPIGFEDLFAVWTDDIIAEWKLISLNIGVAVWAICHSPPRKRPPAVIKPIEQQRHRKENEPVIPAHHHDGETLDQESPGVNMPILLLHLIEAFPRLLASHDPEHAADSREKSDQHERHIE